MALTNCKIWEKGKTKAGYGAIRINGVMQYAHKYFYESKHGKVSKGYNNREVNQVELAKKFNIHQSHISRIINYKKWC